MAVTRGLPYTSADGATRTLALNDIVEMFQTGMGRTLGGIGAILCLGAILGKLFGESGGAEVLAKRIAALLVGPGVSHQFLKKWQASGPV
jgi:H+/gluconate symporter-like permease